MMYAMHPDWLAVVPGGGGAIWPTWAIVLFATVCCLVLVAFIINKIRKR